MIAPSFEGREGLPATRALTSVLSPGQARSMQALKLGEKLVAGSRGCGEMYFTSNFSMI